MLINFLFYLKVSAQDKVSGKTEKVTITSDKGRLGEEEIARMVKEAEEHAQEDKNVKSSVEARNVLESYLYSIKTVISETLKNKIQDNERDTLNGAITDGFAWLESHAAVEYSKSEFDDKRAEIEAIVNPVLTPIYQRSSSASGDASAAGGSAESESAGPTVEEAE